MSLIPGTSGVAVIATDGIVGPASGPVNLPNGFSGTGQPFIINATDANIILSGTSNPKLEITGFTSAHNVTIDPTGGILSGEVFEINNKTNFIATIKANNGDTITTCLNGMVTLSAKIANPAVGADWEVRNICAPVLLSSSIRPLSAAAFNMYLNDGTTVIGSYSTAGAWTLGPAPSTGSVDLIHKFQADGRCTVSITSSNWAGSTSQVKFYYNNSVLGGTIGTARDNQMIGGSGNGALNIKSNSTNIAFSTDDGITRHGQIDTVGAWTLGPASGSAVTNISSSRNFRITCGDSTGGEFGSGLEIYRDYTLPTQRTIINHYNGQTCFVSQSAPTNGSFNFKLYNGTTVTSVMSCNDTGSFAFGTLSTPATHLFMGSNATNSILRLTTAAAGGGFRNMLAFYLDSGATPCGGIQTINNVTAPSFFTGSDIALKDNIVDDTTDYLTKICQIKLRNFTSKADTSNTIISGVIAQELQPIFPDLVNMGESGLLQVNINYHYKIIGAIQQQQKIIDALKSRIEALESK